MQKEFSFYKIFSEFFILGLYSFGGPTAHIGFFQEKFVKRKKWLSEKKFMEFVSLSQFLPGPSSSQVGFLIGLQKGSYWGGLAAWLGFTIPSAFLMILSALIIVTYTNTNGMSEAVKFLNGFASVAIPIIAVALINMGKNFCFEIKRLLIFFISFFTLLIWEFPFEQVIIISLGFALGVFFNLKDKAIKDAKLSIGEIIISKKNLNLLLLIFILVSIFFLILLPIINVYNDILFLKIFSGLYKSGSLVFGGGHVVLPYLEKEFVFNNLISKELFNGGYGLAQALPGPLFSFASYIGTVIGASNDILHALFLGISSLIFIFLPGLMIAMLAINYWNRLIKLNWVYNGIHGVNATVVGLLCLTFVDILLSNYLSNINGILLIILSTLLIIFLKFPSWLSVVIMGPIGYIVYSF